MMKRREFGQKLGGAAIAAALAGPAAASAAQALRKNTLMHVGGDYHSVAGRRGITSRENLEYNLRHGVKHLTAQMRNRREGGGWDPDELKRMKDDCDHHGVILEAIRMDADYISLPKAAEREGQLDTIIGNIKKAADVGVKVITYHWTVIPIRRNGRTTGRGGSTYTCTSCSARRRTERPGRSRSPLPTESGRTSISISVPANRPRSSAGRSSIRRARQKA